MKQAITLLTIFLLSWSVSVAQGDRVVMPATFEDSVRVALENSRSIDATVVGAGFFAVWNQLSLDQQLLIKKTKSADPQAKVSLEKPCG